MFKGLRGLEEAKVLLVRREMRERREIRVRRDVAGSRGFADTKGNWVRRVSEVSRE